MEIMQGLILIGIAAGGLVVVRTREPLAQIIVFSFYGLLLALLFVIYQAPAVAFSQLSVGAVVVPLLLVLAVARVRRRSK